MLTWVDMYSVNDPIFFLHHSFVDKIWWDWQNMDSSNKYAYGGRHRGKRVKVTDIMVPFLDTPISSVFDLDTSLCVRYEEFSEQKFHSSSKALEMKDSNDEAKNMHRKLAFQRPKPIPESWIEMMSMNVTEFRNAENDFANLIIISENQTDPDNESDNSSCKIKIWWSGFFLLFLLGVHFQ